jgi:hypothetical protein
VTALSKALRWRRGLEKRAAFDGPVPVISAESKTAQKFDIQTWQVATEHILDATFRSRAFLTEGMGADSRLALERQMRKHIIEAVFGEFRPRFRALEEALWGHDYAALANAIDAFERAMFDPGDD